MTSSGKRNAHARRIKNKTKAKERSRSASLRFEDFVVVEGSVVVARDSIYWRVVCFCVDAARGKVVSDLMDKHKRLKKKSERAERRDGKCARAYQNTRNSFKFYSILATRLASLHSTIF